MAGTNNTFRPRVHGTQELSHVEFAFVTKDRSVRIIERKASISPDSYVMRGFVESSTGGRYFYVKERVLGKDVMESSCTCSGAHFYGNPCSHALKMRNAYVRHRDEIRTGALKAEARK